MNDCEYHNPTYFGRRDGESIHRLLSSAEEEEYYVDHGEYGEVDHLTLGVFVLTLGLLLFVEVLRHWTDVAAHGHVFFQTVLEVIYREITTLGIVELFLHILEASDVHMNAKLIATFTQVHFMLFYTAILNAIQSCLVRLLTVRKTDKTWLMAEDIEVAHYVAIRKEYDRLERKIKARSPGYTGSRYLGILAARAWPTGSLDNGSKSPSSSCREYWESFHGALSDLVLRIRHFRLYRRRDELLHIVRFHELRVHFIECNNLPPKFNVSSYLERSLRSVLVDFVHISPLAWISVMASANLLFFIAAMVLNNTHASPHTDKFLLYIFVTLMVLSVASTIVLYFKMRYIVFKIQEMKLSHQSVRPTLISALNEGTTKSFDQLDLFWGSNPRLVITISQFLQFGYALGFAGILSYFRMWREYSVNHIEFTVGLLFCYVFSTKVFADCILPWYAICTSMGQLVNKEMLDEILAKQRLSEEIRKKELIEEEKNAEKDIARLRNEAEDENAIAATKAVHAKRIIKDTTKSSPVISDDDDKSDIDDVPEAILSDATTITRQERMKAFGKGKDLKAFFQSSQYRTISFVCGPVICFWIIARTELFNISEGHLGDFRDRTELWHRRLDEFFWIEVSWYCLMIIEMFLVLAVFMINRDRGGSLFSCSAAVSGLMIVLLCMLLLFIAEMKRCCQDNSNVAEGIHEADNGDVAVGIHEAEVGHRLLASESTKNDHIDDPPLEDIACCPKFGTREYGGLGEIEPFTSLIVLYPMRFLFASCIVALFGNRSKKEQHEEKHKWSHHHGHHGIDLVKMRYFWMTAIGLHSEVAEMFGLYSGEMLQCMLGIYSKKNIDDCKELETSIRDDQNSDDNKLVEHQTSLDQISEEGTVDHPSRQLSCRIQPFCMSSRELTSPLKSSINLSDDVVTFDDFSYPTARLIRRMRRCERLLLPFLDEWTVVDAALTSHELILFNALDDDTVDTLAPDHAISNFANGGKGMYLCDVARGRRIVCQFNLDEIELVEIEHRIAITQNNIFSEDVEVNNSNNIPEYWEGGNISSEGYQVSSMNKRWRHVNEDRLKIRFKHQTLFLRFVADLKEMEHKSKVSNSGDNSSNITDHVGAEAKLWCRTMARLRGVTNLRQSLVHFGDDDVNDEIKDFVKMCNRDDYDEGHNAMNFRRSLQRQSTIGAKRLSVLIRQA